ncbi:hypothetical protein AVEN_58896-1 [Araneus ventricosus]|uniref:Uncharacterized protein n=1 Tax=Araneus ventricosus TaxID=182803 RepID=A0A4Y2U0V3_ARAVE|nr:hypothetical protein AVEN_157333-1 [Araneus ventricosus]GBO06365.1 hypothetical protein AVEN_58896-1 [Araneus ventricosus]
MIFKIPGSLKELSDYLRLLRSCVLLCWILQETRVYCMIFKIPVALKDFVITSDCYEGVYCFVGYYKNFIRGRNPCQVQKTEDLNSEPSQESDSENVGFA